jgi:hypothetical protein
MLNHIIMLCITLRHVIFYTTYDLTESYYISLRDRFFTLGVSLMPQQPALLAREGEQHVLSDSGILCRPDHHCNRSARLHTRCHSCVLHDGLPT